MSIEEAIRVAVREEIRPLAERLEAALARIERGAGEQYLSLDDAAERTGLSKTTLRERLADGSAETTTVAATVVSGDGGNVSDSASLHRDGEVAGGGNRTLGAASGAIRRASKRPDSAQLRKQTSRQKAPENAGLLHCSSRQAAGLCDACAATLRERGLVVVSLEEIEALRRGSR